MDILLPALDPKPFDVGGITLNKDAAGVPKSNLELEHSKLYFSSLYSVIVNYGAGVCFYSSRSRLDILS